MEKAPGNDGEKGKRKNDEHSVHTMTHTDVPDHCNVPLARESMAKMIVSSKLLLFDLDGLLVDTEAFHWKAYRATCEKLGGSLPWSFEKYLSLSGKSATAIEEQLRQEQPSLFAGRTWNDIYIEKKRQLEYILSTQFIPLMPGVKPFIEAHAHKPMAVVTNSPKSFTELVVKSHPFLATIPCWVYREKYHAPKPSPEGYLLACTEMNVAPADALGFEDSLRGVDALLKAGCTPILVNDRDLEFQKVCVERKILVIPSLS
jgi:HAD superfamily hydrolase (TIGR01509 family)